MNLSKVSANGQLTLPAEIRRLLGVKSGDKVLFIQKEGGDVVISNASAISNIATGLAEAPKETIENL